MTFKPELHSLVPSDELTNRQYHEVQGWYSSSQFKEALNDIQTFHKLYITGEIEKTVSPQTQAAFDVGTYYHTAVLEPENLAKECAVWDGIRKGKLYEEFLEKNKGKVVITAKDFEKANALITATKKDAATVGLIDEGNPELSAFSKIGSLKVKVRADFINMEKGYIVDLKSTTGNVRDKRSILNKIDSLDYDLSAALYIDTFNAALKRKAIKDFYWSFASKDQVSCQVYRATPEMLEIGRRKYRKALEEIAKAKANKWVFKSEVLDLDPLPWTKELWLENKKEEEKGKKTHKPQPRKTVNSADLL